MFCRRKLNIGEIRIKIFGAQVFAVVLNKQPSGTALEITEG